MKPTEKPHRPQFSSGPCVKRPGWSPDVLTSAPLGRSHRAAAPKARLQRVIAETRALLGVPESHRIAIVPASDTGAVEIALWSLLGARGVDILAWEIETALGLLGVTKLDELDPSFVAQGLPVVVPHEMSAFPHLPDGRIV